MSTPFFFSVFGGVFRMFYFAGEDQVTHKRVCLRMLGLIPGITVDSATHFMLFGTPCVLELNLGIVADSATHNAMVRT